MTMEALLKDRADFHKIINKRSDIHPNVKTPDQKALDFAHIILNTQNELKLIARLSNGADIRTALLKLVRNNRRQIFNLTGQSI